MTIQPTVILRTLALAALVLQPLAAGAQGARVNAASQAPAQRPAPAPAPRTPAAETPAPTTPPAAPAATSPAPAAPAAPARAGVRPWNEEEYRLGPGDKLSVVVYGQNQLSQTVQVRPDGKITLPLAGDTTAAGRTSNELRDALTASLKEYVTNPVVTVIVQEANSAQVHVIGEVASPGSQVLTGPMTVLQALAAAGGLKEFAKKGDIRILRGSSQTPIPFDYKDAINGRIGPVFVQPGDTIVVP
jgi:polysaccharide export outer membrane protein